MSKISIYINLFFFVVFLVHVSFIAINLKSPQYPSIKVYKKNLEKLGYYPISIELCAGATKPESSSMKSYRKFGYSHDYSFFMGQSEYNESIKGWNGHTRNATTITSLNGRCKNKY